MTTGLMQKRLSPWNVRAGDRIVVETMPRDIARDGAPRAYEVTDIMKQRSIFTGASVWRIKYADGQSPWGFAVASFHGRAGNLPTEKVTILAQ